MFTHGSSPWIRRLALLVVIVLVIVVALLLVHLALMGSAHYDGVGCATCSTVLFVAVAIGLGALLWSARPCQPDAIVGRKIPLQPLAAITTGRHPPPRGVVLRV